MFINVSYTCKSDKEEANFKKESKKKKQTNLQSGCLKYILEFYLFLTKESNPLSDISRKF